MAKPKITFIDEFGNATQRDMTNEEAAEYLAMAEAANKES